MAEGLRGRGVGSALLGVLHRTLRSAGPWRQMIAIVGDSANAGSIALHRRFGFELDGRPEIGRLQIRRAGSIRRSSSALWERATQQAPRTRSVAPGAAGFAGDHRLPRRAIETRRAHHRWRRSSAASRSSLERAGVTQAVAIPRRELTFSKTCDGILALPPKQSPCSRPLQPRPRPVSRPVFAAACSCDCLRPRYIRLFNCLIRSC